MGGSSGGSGGQYWHGTSPAPAPAPASPQSAGGGFYQGPGMWLPGRNAQTPVNQPQSQGTPSSGGSYSGWGANQFQTVNPVQGMQAPQAPQAPQALLDSLRGGGPPPSIGMGGPTNWGQGWGAQGSMSQYPGGDMGANRWWAPSGRAWGR
jgi:hypothetical protein